MIFTAACFWQQNTGNIYLSIKDLFKSWNSIQYLIRYELDYIHTLTYVHIHTIYRDVCIYYIHGLASKMGKDIYI